MKLNGDTSTFTTADPATFSLEDLDKLLRMFEERPKVPEVRLSKYVPLSDKDGQPCAFLLDLNEPYKHGPSCGAELHRLEMKRKPWWDGTVILIHPDTARAFAKKAKVIPIRLAPKEGKERRNDKAR